MNMKRWGIAFFFLLCCLIIKGQNEGKSYVSMMERLDCFSKNYPQEKLFIHLDNTLYYLGDTIWFKAYCRETFRDRPSSMSGVLYVELLNDDGYLMERKLVELKNGEGCGFFHLPNDDIHFCGFYELRAYTRWQLNWGAFEHEHSTLDAEWFFNKAACREFFRDYDKIYSRVFPVYEANDAEELDLLQADAMFSRPKMRRYKENPEKANGMITLFPEGGHLVMGVPNNIAYEATSQDGTWLEGNLTCTSYPDISAPTLNRGRGIFTIIPSKSKSNDILFTTNDGNVIKASLPRIEDTGVALSISKKGGERHLLTNFVGIKPENLFISVMYEGKIESVFSLADNNEVILQEDTLCCGIHQITVFDNEGRVWADRLFFVSRESLMQPTITISELKQKIQPYEKVELKIKTQNSNANLSLSIRDVGKGNRHNYDTGSILTEMLLCSEIKGFVPYPEWFFEVDDEVHRTALDLLMMTQGWRRFEWKDMALPGHWSVVQPLEKTPILIGAVHTYRAVERYDPIQVLALRQQYSFMGMSHEMVEEAIREHFGFPDKNGQRYYHGKDLKKNSRADSVGATKELAQRMLHDGEKLKHEVKVHCQWGDFFSLKALELDTQTKDGAFQIQLPRAYGSDYLYLTASDTTKWRKSKRKDWILANDSKYPEFYVRISYPYPHFVKPYNYYQTSLMPITLYDFTELPVFKNVTQMIEVNIIGKMQNMQKYMYYRPILEMDAYDAFNMVVDAGFMESYYNSTDNFATALARYHVADMGIRGRYRIWKRFGDIYSDPTSYERKTGNQKFQIDGKNPYRAIKEYNQLRNLKSVYIYSDYAPRLEGDKKFRPSNRPNVGVLFKKFDDNKTRRVFTDRCIKQQGFSYVAEFYSPDYSRQSLPKGKKDYRRTLYWNPNLKLDENGEAHITFYNNSRITHLSVEAEGQATDGTLLWGIIE